MSPSIKLTAAIFLLLLAAQAECQGCMPSSISVEQTNTGKKAGGIDTVFQVTVTNRCRCAVNNVYLQSNGFSSSTPVDPKLFRRAGSSYLLGDGRRIPGSKSVTFQYAWDHYFKMAPASVQAQC
ncbi:TPD1 protein homolog 1A-like [Panicum virgatum]|uniref:Uncharacterized protein n=1 Tax=Panicum virgatum TaxID=38727 RepID=A0A8T0V735_PANVG|nr:TPD1 protein homolog 1A-like [Panicum virgatum]KAG2629164.1 hypothetical protein PVAP13_3KG399600 [Panicum virgatum]